MAVTVPLFASQLNEGFGIEEIKKIYQNQYQSGLVSYREPTDEGGFFSAAGLSDLDRMEVSVAGNEERILLLARYDNLGKGASGAALECMNMVLGADAETGLEL